MPLPGPFLFRERSAMNLNFYTLCVIYLVYSFLGWVGETVVATAKGRRFTNRGVASGPFCFVYGTAGVLITIGLNDQRTSLAALFFGSMIYATVVEWLTAKLLERIHHRRWWDYSDKRFNLDGYVCLGASLTWGALGVVVLKWGNPLLLALYSLVPRGIWVIVLLAALVVFCVDLVGTLLAMAGLRYRWPAAEAVENRLANLTVRGGMWILDHVERRMAKAHPALTFVRPKRQQTDTFAAGCSPYKIILLFFIGAFLGDITETIFCRVTGGEWMSRSSVVWGPFSIVWGLAIAMVTQLLYRYKDKPASWLFVMGTLLGGAYEYLCSVFTEVVFGAVFWDYSAIPFNLGGRINLLYCFFWGIAAVTWIRYGYPLVAKGMKAVKRRIRPWMTALLAVFMAVNLVTSALALARYDARTSGEGPKNSIDTLLDAHFDDARMERIYPNAKKVTKAG